MNGSGESSSEVRTMHEPVELSIPVRSDLVLLARLTGATVASREGFDVEEVDDLRLAIDELCVLVAGGGSAGHLKLIFISQGGEVEVICTLDDPGAEDARRTDEHAERDLSIRILDALVDEHGEEFEGGQRRGWLRKRSIRHDPS